MLAPVLRVLKVAFQDFYRNFWLSIVTVTMVTLALLSVNLLIVLDAVATTAVHSIESTVDITVYFKPDVRTEQVSQVREYLQSQPHVATIALISSDEALQRFKEKHKNNDKILRSLDELNDNPLGASLVIKADTTDAYPALLEKLQEQQYAQLIDDKDFDDHRALIQAVATFSNRVTTSVAVIAALFSVIAIMIIFNTVRVAIYTHRDEIRAMKLVGATDMFVRAPFLLESFLYSLLALLITIAILYPFLGFIQPYVSEVLSAPDFNIVNYFNDRALVLFGWQLVGITVINLAGSAVAVGKYLRV